MSVPVIAIFDIGKTNKKLLLFNEQYEIVYEKQACLHEITDEDGDACEDLEKLRHFILQQFTKVLKDPCFEVRAVNVAAYGASLVYISEAGLLLAPLYNYLKPYPAALAAQFYTTYGDKQEIACHTASPAMGSLNAGLQLYRIKHTQPALYNRTRYALHLPQYLSYLFSGYAYSDMTSIGCHTALWDFEWHHYHHWVSTENIQEKLAPVMSATHTSRIWYNNRWLYAGIGLHDSSAALIPYLQGRHEPFILISTGTWCVSMNPFDHTPLTQGELAQGCLHYISYKGRPVKASRIFAGQQHTLAVARIAAHFGVAETVLRQMAYDPALLTTLRPLPASGDITGYPSSTAAYHALMQDIVAQQRLSTGLIAGKGGVKQLFVDGGFAGNAIYMHLLAQAFPDMEVYAATVSQASATGAALVIHDTWNKQARPENLVNLQRYS